MAKPGQTEVVAWDPAYMKYNEMIRGRHKYFRWTPRTAWINVVYVLVVPTMFGVLAYKTDGKYEFRGKRRGDTIVEY